MDGDCIHIISIGIITMGFRAPLSRPCMASLDLAEAALSLGQERSRVARGWTLG